ncbi:hypothetical protein GCM10009819_16500 [Agromyces tropicus]|uniref:Uncharacterized protein n=1 Tax=Agromyces tropicus TaxID=555371 RepID=A0ABP5FSJ4_9MICO
MAEPIEVGIVSYTLSADVYERVGADFDTEAVDDAILSRLNQLVPSGVVVHRNGKAFADPEVADVARGLDWQHLLSQIDVDQILADHSR